MRIQIDRPDRAARTSWAPTCQPSIRVVPAISRGSPGISKAAGEVLARGRYASKALENWGSQTIHGTVRRCNKNSIPCSAPRKLNELQGLLHRRGIGRNFSEPYVEGNILKREFVVRLCGEFNRGAQSVVIP
jgi:hypothetical protein